MTEEQARLHLIHMQVAAQKVRSNLSEENITEAEIQDTQPWLSGKQDEILGIPSNTIVTALEKVLQKEQIEPIDFYNMQENSFTEPANPTNPVG